MNETPLHEPLIAEEGKEKERVFTGTPERIVNICLASISALVIYWTVYVSADVMWKHGLYIMTVFCMTLVIYPFEKKPKVKHISLVDWLLIIGSIAGSAYAIWEYLDRFMRLGMLTEMDIFFGCLMLFLGLEVGRRVIGWCPSSSSSIRCTDSSSPGTSGTAASISKRWSRRSTRAWKATTGFPPR